MCVGVPVWRFLEGPSGGSCTWWCDTASKWSIYHQKIIFWHYWKESSTLPWLRPQMYSMQVWECTVGMLYIIQMHSCFMLLILLRKPKHFLRIDCEIIFSPLLFNWWIWTKFPPYRKKYLHHDFKGKVPPKHETSVIITPYPPLPRCHSKPMTYFLMWNIKEDILTNVGSQTKTYYGVQ